MYLVLEDTYTDTASRAVWPQETFDAAVAMFHNTLGYQMNNVNCKSCLVMVIGENGEVYKSEKYVNETPPEVAE